MKVVIGSLVMAWVRVFVIDARPLDAGMCLTA